MRRQGQEWKPRHHFLVVSGPAFGASVDVGDNGSLFDPESGMLAKSVFLVPCSLFRVRNQID
jgi:hypothetical protein